MRIQKIKDFGTMAARYNHDYRIAKVENADPALKDKNEILFALQDDDGTELSYENAWKKRLREAQLKGGWIGPDDDTKIRKGGVLAYDVVLTFSAGSRIDLEEWKKRNVRWLQTTFNRSLNGGQNLISCVVHNDEGNIHCHAFIIPITPDERLCASYYTGDRGKMSRLQDSYAKAMEPLGLQRGQKGSSAKHKDMKHVYAQLKQDIRIPRPKHGELADDYLKRAEADIRDQKGSSMQKIHAEERSRRSKMDEQLALEREELRKEQEAILLTAMRERDSIISGAKDAEEKRKETEARIEEAKKECEAIMANMHALSEKYGKQVATYEKMEELQKFMKGMEWQESNDPDGYKLTKNAYETCLDCAEQFLEPDDREFDMPETLS